MSTDKLWTVISGIEYQLNILKDKLKNLDEETKQSVDEAYQRGLQDGKKAIHKGCEGCKYEGGTVERNPCFICCNYYQNYWTAKKQDDEIKVGDEVRHERGWTAVVTWILDNRMTLMGKDGAIADYHISDKFTKTDRHFDIMKILKEMQT